MTFSLHPCPASLADLRVHVPRYLAPITLAPQITPLNEATPGDIVAMVSYLRGNVDLFPSHEHSLQAFIVQGKDRLEIAFYQDLAGRAATQAARLIAEQLFANHGLHDLVLDCDLVPNVEAYELYRVHFADAILTFEATWLRGDLEDDVENMENINPVVIEMGQVSDRASAEACVTKTRRYLETLRRMLPDDLRDQADWSIALPAPEVFLYPSKFGS